MSWEIVKLCDCCQSIADGDHQAPPKAESGVPFVTISNIDHFNRFDFSDTMFVPQMYYDKLDEKRKAVKGDVLLSVVGSFGIPVLIKDDTPFVFQRHIAILRPNPNIIMPEFLYYTMLSKSFYAQADAYAVGAAQRTISLTSLRKMKIAIPPLEAQNDIVAILSQYDSAIENNNKRIALLEQMAETLYKDWFSYEKIKEISTEVRLREVIQIVRGLSYSTEEIDVDEGINLVNLKNIQAFGGFRRDGTKAYNGKYKKEQVVIYGDLIMGVTDMTQDRRTVGSVAIVPKLPSISLISADLIKIVSDIDNVFLYAMFKYGNVSRYISQFANGANVLHLRPQAVLNIKVILPPQEMIDKYVRIAKPLIEQIEMLNQANANLTKQRDMLLPRLMNGKLEV